MKYWSVTADRLHLPAGTVVAFSAGQTGSSTYLLDLTKRDVFALTFTVNRGVSLGNYGFAPNGFEVAEKALGHIRTVTISVKAHFALTRTTETDPVAIEQYTRWNDALLDGISEYFSLPGLNEK
jgi:hypothetical protein